MSITAIVFDLDETLVPDEEATNAALVAACAPLEQRCGVPAAALAATVRFRARELWRAGPEAAYCQAIGIASWEGLWGDCRGADPRLARLTAWLPGYREAAWQRALADYGIEDHAVAAELACSYPELRRSLCSVYDDAEPALQALRHPYRLGVMTNGAPALQRDKLAASGLAGYFDAVVVSGEIGAGKPDARIFNRALSLLGARAEEAAMVGDTLERDVLGAIQAGMLAVWMNRGGGVRSPEIEPHAEIATLHELGAVLALPGHFTGS